MKVIFLDIDGVLNSQQSMIEAQRNKNKKELGITFPDNPHPEHIKHLNLIVEKTGAKVVISSTWRKGNSWVLLWRFLQAMGFKGEVIGNTPSISHKKRGVEIFVFINDHNSGKYKSIFNPDEPVDKIESFVILDDDSDMKSDECDLMSHLVQTKNEMGLQHEHALKAIEILNGKPIYE